MFLRNVFVSYFSNFLAKFDHAVIEYAKSRFSRNLFWPEANGNIWNTFLLWRFFFGFSVRKHIKMAGGVEKLKNFFKKMGRPITAMIRVPKGQKGHYHAKVLRP